MPRVSVVIPVRNEAASIRRTLEGLQRQDCVAADFEVLVVDGMSDDDTVAIVRDVQRSFPNLRLLFNPKRLASVARNVGVRHATGDYLVVIDGHCAIGDRQYLTNLVRAFEETGADTLGRPQPLRADRPSAFQRAVSAARMSWLGHNPDSAIFSDRPRFVDADNVAVAYRRRVFDTVGYFDEDFDACEDVDFNTRVRRAGLTCYFTPAISVDYQPRATLKGLAYQMMRYGQGRSRLGRKYPSTITAPSLVPALWLVWLAVAGLVAVVWTPAALALAATISAYILIVVAESARVARDASVFRLPIVFAAIHVGFAWGYIKEAVVGFGSMSLPFRLPTNLRRERAARPWTWGGRPVSSAAARP